MKEYRSQVIIKYLEDKIYDMRAVINERNDDLRRLTAHDEMLKAIIMNNDPNELLEFRRRNCEDYCEEHYRMPQEAEA